MLQFEDFCRSTGLDHGTVENLMRTELRDISMWRDEELTHPFGILDDALPTAQELAVLGLPVRDDYDPEALRSYEMGDDEEDQEVKVDEDADPSHTLTW